MCIQFLALGSYIMCIQFLALGSYHCDTTITRGTVCTCINTHSRSLTHSYKHPSLPLCAHTSIHVDYAHVFAHIYPPYTLSPTHTHTHVSQYSSFIWDVDLASHASVSARHASAFS